MGNTTELVRWLTNQLRTEGAPPCMLVKCTARWGSDTHGELIHFPCVQLRSVDPENLLEEVSLSDNTNQNPDYIPKNTTIK